ncbi:flagellar export chaperone FliS [Planobispora longispora]|uniref:flagellar export chaperone FliS n=1 Tax=Planobispora longispora TaxID=28887 RepID=UPI0036232611|nr:hypothetical protein GCM10020093_117950 [Planobispora longispora]
MTNPSMRARYIADTVNTASPGQLLVMLYDRLVLDLTRAEEALGRGDREAAAQQLMHAQDIIIELRSSLKTDGWDGAAASPSSTASCSPSSSRPTYGATPRRWPPAEP